MQITYKINYDYFKEYFAAYEGEFDKFSMILLKILNWMMKNSFWTFMAVFMVSIFISAVILRLISKMAAYLILELLNNTFSLTLNTSMPFFSNNAMEFMFSAMIILVIFIITFIVNQSHKASLPYVLRDLIADIRVLKDNIDANEQSDNTFKKIEEMKNEEEIKKSDNPKSFSATSFSLLSIFRAKESIGHLHDFIPGVSSAVTLSGAKNRLRDTYVDKIPILNKDYSYNEWDFKLTNFEGKIDQMDVQRYDGILKTLWSNYLDIEYERFKRRRDKKKAKKVFYN